MKKLPEMMPEYTIVRTKEKPFSVCWEELQGWFLIPRLGESCTWGMYDLSERRLNHSYELKALGRAIVHGIEGVEISAKETPDSPKKDSLERIFIAQLTDTHCRYLAVSRRNGDLQEFITFLDEDDLYPNWGYGENNCGNETHLYPKGIITREGNQVRCPDERFMLDLTDRCILTIGGKTYDTVCLMNIESLSLGVISEQYLDCHGRTVLWRRFNRDDWAFQHYQKKWTEILPDNERLTINGDTYVHWYDCISDYIL